ncbi:MAG: hypothetical protein A2W93_11900 [Bacteroidetes bacterium GWF2_43_63]|nr:MAG: hypothetical protein A2W94_00435 [Bacteroidetes bacterium GWE2_42_42]OFY55447.1 MAG: hypothetical protein A2W93_11900 [Bacteroidetes bacterium GWF2_43_63]HBG70302.1 hypothetical protein [Bacteroidales bacterium]HCB60313.1 hypothetical protein [Bacteroidales bacterium]HCY23575.1 hypothetical protein [Bacteroidales bacterium]
MGQETMNILIASLSALATIAAAIIYYWTLREIKRQRQNTYRPHLFIDSISYNVIGVEKEKIIMPLHWTNKPEDHNTIRKFGNDINTHDFNLHCYNIGFGTAKKVDIKFKYDMDGFIEKINKLGKNVDPKLLIEIKNNSEFVSFLNQNEALPFIQCGISTKYSMHDYLSYVLPVNISNTYIPIKMPALYLELLNISIHYLSNLKDKSECFEGDDFACFFPIIKATIIYEDIYNKPESKNIEIVTELYASGSIGYCGRFKINEI